jgi:predicted DNA-binding protein
MAIFLFELTRVFKSGHDNYLYSKDQFQFKILHFFSTLRRAQEVDTPAAATSTRFSSQVKDSHQGQAKKMGTNKCEMIIEDIEPDTDDSEDLSNLLDEMHLDQQKNACVNC